MGYYKVGQACLRGHAVTGDRASPFAAKHCPKCGEETISQCPACNSIIRGDFEVEGVFSLGGYAWDPTAHCHQCGAPYPWTQAKLDAVEELAAAIEELTTHEREVINELAPHIIQDTPRTNPASFKIATIVGKLSGHAGAAMKRLLEEIAVEAAKTSLGIK